MADIYEKIGQTIRDLRQRYPQGPLSQEALAAKLKIASNTISRWETGTYKPSAEDLHSLATFFNVSITVFFPDLQDEGGRIQALTSAIGGLNEKEFDDLISYAEFRKVRQAMQKVKRPQSKR